MNKSSSKNFQPEPMLNSGQKADDMHVRPAIWQYECSSDTYGEPPHRNT